MHVRLAGRRSGILAVAPAVSAMALMLAPGATAAETTGPDAGTAGGGATTATATFDSATCTAKSRTVDVSVKNPSPSSATFAIHVSGPNVPVPNSITVPASGSNGVKVTIPKGAKTATVNDSTGATIGTTTIKCSGSSAGASAPASDGASAGASAAASSDAAAPAASTTKSSSSNDSNSTRKLAGYGLAGLGVLLAIVLLIREFK